MIWVTWRRHRTSLVVSLGIIAALMVTALVSARIVKGHGYGSTFGVYADCQNEMVVCVAQTALTVTTVVATLLPVFLGALVGVTVFSRDIEQGTHVLGLTQSVSRSRWFWMRVLVVFLPLTLAAAVFGLVPEWTRKAEENRAYAVSASLFDAVGLSNLVYPLFQSSGIVLGAYTFMALTLGAGFTLLIRGSIGAMALTMVGVVAILAGFQFAARPHYAPASVETSATANSRNDTPFGERSADDWVIDTHRSRSVSASFGCISDSRVVGPTKAEAVAERVGKPRCDRQGPPAQV